MIKLSQFSPGTRLVAAIACGLLAISAPAATVVHYTFDGANPLNDISGNNLHLTNNNSVAIAGGSATFDGSNHLSTSSNALYDFGNRFTAEMFFTTASSLSSATILGIYSGTANNRSFEIQTRGNSDLRVLLEGPTAGNSDLETLTFSLNLQTETEYFLALVFNGTLNNNPGNERVRLYYQDITNGGSLSTLAATTTLSSLNTPSDGLGLGGRADGTSLNSVALSEVRISDTPISSGALLINNVPEPSRALLLSIAACSLGLRRRRTFA